VRFSCAASTGNANGKWKFSSSLKKVLHDRGFFNSRGRRRWFPPNSTGGTEDALIPPKLLSKRVILLVTKFMITRSCCSGVLCRWDRLFKNFDKKQEKNKISAEQVEYLTELAAKYTISIEDGT
jgi:enolase